MSNEELIKKINIIIVRAQDECSRRTWDCDETGWENVDRIWMVAEEIKEGLKKNEEIQGINRRKHEHGNSKEHDEAGAAGGMAAEVCHPDEQGIHPEGR